MNRHLPARSLALIGLVLTRPSYPPVLILNPSRLSPLIRLFAQVPFFILLKHGNAETERWWEKDQDGMRNVQVSRSANGGTVVLTC